MRGFCVFRRRSLFAVRLYFIKLNDMINYRSGILSPKQKRRGKHMETIAEILIDCVLSLVVDGGVEVMTDSSSCRRWPKGVRIALVAVTMAVFAALTGFVVFAGASFISEGKIAAGVVFLVIAFAFVIFSIIGLIKAYRKKKRDEHT